MVGDAESELHEQVRKAASLLLAAGLFNALLDVVILIWWVAEGLHNRTTGDWIGLVYLSSISALLIFAALRTRKMRSYWLARVATVLAVIPITSPNCLSIVLGYLASRIIEKPEVKALFR
jgi:hypothetical protein